MNLLHRISRGGARVSGTVVLLAAVVAVLGCYLVGIDRAAAQRAAQQQYDQDAQGLDAQATPEPEQVTLCHYNPGEGGRYVTITVGYQSAAYQGHRTHPNDIIPAPAGGCPSGPGTATATAEPTTPEPTTPEPTTVSPTATATATATATGGETTPEPTTPEPTTPEPTTVSPTATATATATATGGATTAEPCPDPEPTTASPTATATGEPTQTATAGTASPGFTPTPTAIATKPGEDPGGQTEVTDPDGEATAITLFDLDVDDAPPLPGGPGGITRSEILGQEAAAEALLAGEDFHGAVDAAQPFLNACDSRDAVRLAAVQLGIPMPETGGPAALGIIAAMLLLGSGVFAWRLGVRGRL